MLQARLIELIERHADGLTAKALRDIATNPHTRSFHQIPHDELEARVFATYHNLGNWIANLDHDAVREDYESWGAKRARQGIPLSEIVYALNLVKHHLRQFVRDHGLVESSTNRWDPAELIGVHLVSIQELNYMVGEFFDRAMYHLARGYEAATKARERSASV